MASPRLLTSTLVSRCAVPAAPPTGARARRRLGLTSPRVARPSLLCSQVLHAMTSPLSHALANVMKRAAVISMAFIYAQRPVTPLHLFGVALSVFGTLLYQQLDD